MLEVVELQRMLNKLALQHCRMQQADREEVVSTLLEYFIRKPKGLEKAVKGGYILPFLTNAVKKETAHYKLKMSKMVLVGDFKDENS